MQVTQRIHPNNLQQVSRCTRRIVSVLAVDPGIRNLGLAVCSGRWDSTLQIVTEITPVWARTVDLLRGTKYSRKQHTSARIAELMCGFIAASSHAGSDFRDDVDLVLVEGQMKDSVKGIVHVVQSFYYPKAHVVHPLTYKGEDRGGHRRNKQSSIDWLESTYPDFTNYELRSDTPKKDDIADAVRLGVWGLKNYDSLANLSKTRRRTFNGMDFTSHRGITFDRFTICDDITSKTTSTEDKGDDGGLAGLLPGPIINTERVGGRKSGSATNGTVYRFEEKHRPAFGGWLRGSAESGDGHECGSQAETIGSGSRGGDPKKRS